MTRLILLAVVLLALCFTAGCCMSLKDARQGLTAAKEIGKATVNATTQQVHEQTK